MPGRLKILGRDPLGLLGRRVKLGGHVVAYLGEGDPVDCRGRGSAAVCPLELDLGLPNGRGPKEASGDCTGHLVGAVPGPPLGTPREPNGGVLPFTASIPAGGHHEGLPRMEDDCRHLPSPFGRGRVDRERQLGRLGSPCHSGGGLPVDLRWGPRAGGARGGGLNYGFLSGAQLQCLSRPPNTH